VQRCLAIISVPMIALWLILGVLAATAMYTVAMVLDNKPAFAKAKATAPCPTPSPQLISPEPPCDI